MKPFDDVLDIAIEALTAVNNRDTETLERLVSKLDKELELEWERLSKADGGSRDDT